MLGAKSAGFMSSILSVVNSNQDLKACDPMSVIAAAAVAASLDLPINPSLSFAHIVPYSGRAQFQMGWRGFVQLGMRTGQYKTMNIAVVYEGELKNYNRITGEMEFNLAAKKSDKIIGYVAYFKLLNGFEKYYYMTMEQVTKHGKQYSKVFTNPKGRWVQDFDAMALKTVIKMLLSKYGIMSIDMQKAVTHDQGVIQKDGKVEYIDVPLEQIEHKTDDVITQNSDADVLGGLTAGK
jgi:recombination protein RecT